KYHRNSGTVGPDTRIVLVQRIWPSPSGSNRFSPVSFPPGSGHSDDHRRRGTTSVMVHAVAGPPLGLDQPVVPAWNGPSSRACCSCGSQPGQPSTSVTAAHTASMSPWMVACSVISYIDPPRLLAGRP